MECRLAHEAHAYEESLAERPGVRELLVELDGCDLPVGKLRKLKGRKKTKNRKLPKKTRDCEWREARVGLTRQLEEVNKLYVAKMASYPEVNRQLFGAAVKKGLSSETQVVAVADGGPGLREGLSEWFDKMHFILDHPHCCGHLYEAAEALGLGGEEREHWVRELLEWMSEGDSQAVLRYLREEYLESDVHRVWQLHNYIKRFRDSVHYDDYKERGWSIGSGEVESAHRYIPQERLKIAGAWWLEENINPMLSLRVVRANHWWDDFWKERGQAESA